MSRPEQDTRPAELTTPLGKDVLVLTNFVGTEGLSELFEYNIDALSEEEDIDFNNAIGQSCIIKYKTYDGKTRFFNGILTATRWTGTKEYLFNYHLVLRPWFWLLGRKADCRIFLDKDVKQIIKEVFTDDNFFDFEFRTTRDYHKILFCVQYRETDLAFCCRLMEHYGIYYFFEHSDDKHTLVMADSLASHQAIPELPKVPVVPLSSRELRVAPQGLCRRGHKTRGKRSVRIE